MEWRRTSGGMPAFFLSVFRFVRLLMSGHQAIAIENAALRLQLAAFQRKRERPALTSFDRLFWIALRRFWAGWRGPLAYVQADTVVVGSGIGSADSGRGYRNRMAVVEAGPPRHPKFAD